jgi:hypothetical protein
MVHTCEVCNRVFKQKGHLSVHKKRKVPCKAAAVAATPATATGGYRVISLFSGMGGMDVGFAEQVVVHKDSVDPAFIESEYPIEGFVNLKRLPFTTVFQNDILPEARRLAEVNGWLHNYRGVSVSRL